MKILLFILFILLLGNNQIANAQNVIQFDFGQLPRLSPQPKSVSNLEQSIISLNGIWKFTGGDAVNEDIEVPGEWVMQGFKVNPDDWAIYERTFIIPRDWKGKRIKLRFDAVFSKAEIWVNGQQAGHHLGGFTPFEVDITKYIKASGLENRLLVKVKSSTIADSLASASQYAVHPLGGISRKVFLMAVPKVNFSYFHVSTHFDKNYKNAQLFADIILTNESKQKISSATLFLSLYKDLKMTEKVLSRSVTLHKSLAPNESSQKRIILDVKHPLKWDPEHPNLYWLEIVLRNQNNESETVVRPVGFRQIEVRGNRVFVNNHPIKLRGINRHEVMPLRGRSLVSGQWKKDVKLFRDANINYIRTSHYPPAPEFIRACNKLGMFVEVEAPFCWAHQTKVPDSMYERALVNPTLEMVNEFKSAPSVLMWSLGNESHKYKKYFSKTAALVKAIDPTRPRNFSQFKPNGDQGELEIGNQHYPGLKGVTDNKNSKRPIVFDEYCHINAYDRLEFYTDPSVRYLWGKGLYRMWETMYHTPSILGGAIWAGIDDTFVLPDSSVVGYGVWGIIDGWRRKKPEYWEVKKVYSPVKVIQVSNYNPKTHELPLKIENRFFFTNLDECTFKWAVGKEGGNLHVSALPGASANAAIKLNFPLKQGAFLDLEVFDARGVMVDKYKFQLLPSFVKKNIITHKGTPISYEEHAEELVIRAGATAMIIDKKTGNLLNVSYDGKKVINGSAKLLILPLNGEGFGIQMTGDRKEWPVFTKACKNRVIRNISLKRDNAYCELKIYDSYKEAEGVTTYRLNNSGELTVSYRYTLKEDINPQQWGLVFSLPENFQEFQWNRRGQWSVYPENDIARLQGIAKARSAAAYSGPAGPKEKAGWPWKQDQNELGTNDFRSTKVNIITAWLTDGVHRFFINGKGHTDVRTWLDAEHDCIKLLLASYTGLGAEHFFRSHAKLFDHPLKTGEVISGTFNIRLRK